MPALTETASVVTEFGGQYKTAIVVVDGATGTTNTVQIDELSVVVGAVASLAESPTTTCCGVIVKNNVTTATNVLNVIMVQQTGLPCLTSALDATIIAIGY
jgi:hypothetical protein